MKTLDNWLKETAVVPAAVERPLVSLCYAQSLDGSLTRERGRPMQLSGPGSTNLTHRLRASHAALLVGIGTLLADNPSLNVRYAPGPSPQPVILDSQLRFPLNARLWEANPHRPWIVTQAPANDPRRQALLERGARLLQASSGPPELILPELLHELWKLGIHSLMVEGGARVITSFLQQQLVDRVIVTIAPILVGGLRMLGENGPLAVPVALTNLYYERIEDDMILCGQPVWHKEPRVSGARN